MQYTDFAYIIARTTRLTAFETRDTWFMAPLTRDGKWQPRLWHP
jgi:hypothetical protein